MRLVPEPFLQACHISQVLVAEDTVSPPVGVGDLESRQSAHPEKMQLQLLRCPIERLVLIQKLPDASIYVAAVITH